METTNRYWQNEYPVDPANFDFVGETDSPWHETAEEIEDALEYGKEKARLLKWVRRHMRSKLTARERRCVELLFFHGLSYREAAERTGIHPSVVHRSVQRGLVKLRRQLASRRTHSRLRVTRFRGTAKDEDNRS
jgi:RNA polymerase sigma factor (sigma-70 family)